jgi:hypothetical protein
VFRQHSRAIGVHGGERDFDAEGRYFWSEFRVFAGSRMQHPHARVIYVYEQPALVASFWRIHLCIRRGWEHGF